jgi:hypothetical protein
MNKNILWVLIILLSVGVVNALVVTEPDGVNITRYMNITWTNDLDNAYYDLYLTNITGGNPLWFDRFAYSKNDTELTATTTTITKVATIQLFNSTINNVTINTKINTPGRTSQTRIYINYTDGSNTDLLCTGQTYCVTIQPYYLETTSTSYVTTTFYNQYPEKKVKAIEIWTRATGGTPTPTSIVNNITINDNIGKIRNKDIILAVNDTIGIKRINITGYNPTGTPQETNISNTFNRTRNTLLNIIVRSFTGAIINFTSNLTGEIQTSNNNVIYNTINGTEYLVIITASNNNPYTETFNITTYGITTKNIILTANNSINLTIYNAQNRSIILQNITIIVTSGIAKTYSTTTGNILISNVNTGLNEIKVFNENFSESRYNILLIEGTSINYNAYLLPIGTAQNVTFTFYNPNGVIIRGLQVGTYLLTNTTYILLSSAYTDISGKVYFTYNPLYQYLYTYSGEGYQTTSFILNPPRESNYDITVAWSTIGKTYTKPNITGTTTYFNTTNTLRFNYISTDTNTTTYSYTVSKIINTKPIIICSETSTSLNNNFDCDTTGYTGTIYIQGVGDQYIFYGRTYDLPGGKLSDNINQKDAALISGIIILVILMGGVIFGPIALGISGIIGILIIYWIGILTPLTLTIVIINIIATIIILIGLNKRR